MAAKLTTEKAKPSIVIPESYERKFGVTPDFGGQVAGLPENTIYKWVQNPRRYSSKAFANDTARGFRPMTWADWQAGKYEVKGAYVLEEDGWVAMGDVILITAPVQVRLQANFRRAELDRGLAQQEKTPSIDGEEVEVGEQEGPVSLQKGSYE